VFKMTSISGNLDQHVIEVVLAECDSYIISGWFIIMYI
jgi:hypothetical protein